MIRPTPKLLDDAGINEEAHRFFVLRWHEIFDEYTFDSWQVRSSNLISILGEILISCEIVQRIHGHHPNILMLIDEAAKAAENDLIVNRHFPFVGPYLDDLRVIYDKHIKNKEGLNVKILARSATVILGNLREYRRFLFEDILSIVQFPSPRYKIELYSLTLSLGIELLSSGYSLIELRNSVKSLLASEEVNFPIRFKSFLNRYSGKLQNYNCLFHLSLPKPIDEVDKLPGYDISLTKDRPPEGNWSKEEKKFYEKDKQTVIATVNLNAVDIYSAKIECEQRIEALFAALKLYQATKIPQIKHDVSLVKQEGGNDIFLEADKSRTQYIRDSNSPIENIASFSNILNHLNPDDSAQLLSSLQYHKLAISASTDEAKLVNFWIGLEALLQSGEGSIINKIITYIPPTNSLDYISQLTKFFSISIKDVWRSKDTSQLRKCLRQSTEHILHQRDILFIFLSPPGGEVVKEFCSLLADDPLHLFKAERIYDGYFKSPDKLREVIEKHNQNLVWQLSRIYRVRNRIMHQAGQALHLRQLIQHLHSYYITTIHTLLRDIRLNPSWRIADAFEHRKKLYEHYLYLLGNYKETPVCPEALLQPIHILNDCFGDPAWKI